MGAGAFSAIRAMDLRLLSEGDGYKDLAGKRIIGEEESNRKTWHGEMDASICGCSSSAPKACSVLDFVSI